MATDKDRHNVPTGDPTAPPGSASAVPPQTIVKKKSRKGLIAWAVGIALVAVLGAWLWPGYIRPYMFGPKAEQLADENDRLRIGATQAQNARAALADTLRREREARRTAAATVPDETVAELRDSIAKLEEAVATRPPVETVTVSGPTQADADRARANRRTGGAVRTTTASRGSAVRVSLQRDGCLRNRAVAWPSGLTITPYTANPANSYPRAVVWAKCNRPADKWEDVQMAKLVYIYDPTVECMAGGCQPPDVVALCGWKEPVDDGKTYGYCDNTESLKVRFTRVDDNRWELSAADFPVGTLRDGDIYIYRNGIGTHTRGFVNTQEWMAYLPDVIPVVAVVPFLVYDEVAGTRGNLSNHTRSDASLASTYNAQVADMVARVCIRKDSVTGAMRSCVDERVLCVLVHDKQADAFSVLPLDPGKVCYDPAGPGLARYFNTWLPMIRTLNPNIASR